METLLTWEQEQTQWLCCPIKREEDLQTWWFKNVKKLQKIYIKNKEYILPYLNDYFPLVCRMKGTWLVHSQYKPEYNNTQVHLPQ